MLASGDEGDVEVDEIKVVGEVNDDDDEDEECGEEEELEITELDLSWGDRVGVGRLGEKDGLPRRNLIAKGELNIRSSKELRDELAGTGEGMTRELAGEIEED